ncbi:MAG: DUF86 domain-containing protein [Chloroflexi bacterium]|nr:DUF86 domain-containing protein [Chloroflexota bacterium]
MNDDLVYVRHILDAIAKIESFVKNMTFNKFARSQLAQSATMYQVSIIGEAARHFSPEFQTAHSNIPWPQIVGMRNKLIHEYFGADLGEVWRVTQDDLPELKKQMKHVLRDARKKPK